MPKISALTAPAQRHFKNAWNPKMRLNLVVLAKSRSRPPAALKYLERDEFLAMNPIPHHCRIFSNISLVSP